VVPAAALRAQPADAAPVFTGGPPRGGKGGAVDRLLVPTPASGHCRAVTWLSEVGPTDIPSGIAAPAAATPPAAAAVPSAAPPASVVPRLAHRDVARVPMPGTTAPAAPAVTRRKPKADSRQLTWARSSAPSMP
jgi:hypothetical protein